jgi:hypothetical protein
LPNGEELINVLCPGDFIGLGRGDRYVLIEAGKRRRKFTRKPESAKNKEPLTVIHMIKHLPDAPFISSIAMQRFFFTDFAEK